ncbi:MAG: tRNA lysidine(34) synthetase TilS, partial [Leucobacter sp.]|nr:tRNA lysidine(34) synthetase TilS [Leucobacter sp.]
MRVRLAVRRALDGLTDTAGESPLLLVGLSGGADSLALAAALAAEAPRLAVRAGALVIDHGLQPGSARTAERAADAARNLGLDPVVVRSVEVGSVGGPESAARDARYAAFAEIAREYGAFAILTAHTRDDQAEQVLLALARGSGTRSIAGIPAIRHLEGGVLLVRPLLGADPEVGRMTTVAACRELGLSVWDDPHNTDRAYARVRVREVLLPVLVEELGRGVRAGLARSADLAREDAEALDAWAATVAAEL